MSSAASVTRSGILIWTLTVVSQMKVILGPPMLPSQYGGHYVNNLPIITTPLFVSDHPKMLTSEGWFQFDMTELPSLLSAPNLPPTLLIPHPITHPSQAGGYPVIIPASAQILPFSDYSSQVNGESSLHSHQGSLPPLYQQALSNSYQHTLPNSYQGSPSQSYSNQFYPSLSSYSNQPPYFSQYHQSLPSQSQPYPNASPYPNQSPYHPNPSQYHPNPSQYYPNPSQYYPSQYYPNPSQYYPNSPSNPSTGFYPPNTGLSAAKNQGNQGQRGNFGNYNRNPALDDQRVPTANGRQGKPAPKNTDPIKVKSNDNVIDSKGESSSSRSGSSRESSRWYDEGNGEVKSASKSNPQLAQEPDKDLSVKNQEESAQVSPTSNVKLSLLESFLLAKEKNGMKLEADEKLLKYLSELEKGEEPETRLKRSTSLKDLTYDERQRLSALVKKNPRKLSLDEPRLTDQPMEKEPE